jgi:membrane protease subunit HflC
MMREARDLIRPDMAELGIEVVDVRILRTDLTEQVSAQTFDRMKAERLAEAALLRARGQEAAQSLRAVADRQAVEIIAAARRDAEILRGEGEAARTLIFADAYNRDPEFFEFYRSMQSYRTALGADGTTMVLSPDSEFFQYFGGGQSSLGTPIVSQTPGATTDAGEATDAGAATDTVVPEVTAEPEPAAAGGQ